MIEIVVDHPDRLEARASTLVKRIRAEWNGTKPIVLTMKAWSPKRTRGQNNLYWRWMEVMAKEFSTEGLGSYSREDMHEALAHKFLGSVTRHVLGETYQERKSTTSLSKSEMSDYMRRVEAWAADMGCYLPVPEDNEYAKYREAAV